MNPLNYIFNDMRPEKAKLRRHAPRENDRDKKLEAYRETPSEFDAPLEPLCDIRKKFHGSHKTLYDMDFHVLGSQKTYLASVDTYPDFQLNRSIANVVMFLPVLVCKNIKPILSIFLLAACVLPFLVFPILSILTVLFEFFYGLFVLTAMVAGVIGFVIALIFFGNQVEKVFGQMVNSRPGDKVLSLLMPKWDRHQNKIPSP